MGATPALTPTAAVIHRAPLTPAPARARGVGTQPAEAPRAHYSEPPTLNQNQKQNHKHKLKLCPQPGGHAVSVPSQQKRHAPWSLRSVKGPSAIALEPETPALSSRT